MSKNEPGRKVSDQNKLVSLDTFANSVEKENSTVYSEYSGLLDVVKFTDISINLLERQQY